MGKNVQNEKRLWLRRRWRTYGHVDATIVEKEGGIGEGEIVDLLLGESSKSGGHYTLVFEVS
jgi:hypothetical protein